MVCRRTLIEDTSHVYMSKVSSCKISTNYNDIYHASFAMRGVHRCER